MVELLTLKVYIYTLKRIMLLHMGLLLHSSSHSLLSSQRLLALARWALPVLHNTVDSRYLEYDYLELPLISKRKSGPCLNIEI